MSQPLYNVTHTKSKKKKNIDSVNRSVYVCLNNMYEMAYYMSYETIFEIDFDFDIYVTDCTYACIWFNIGLKMKMKKNGQLCE